MLNPNIKHTTKKSNFSVLIKFGFYLKFRLQKYNEKKRLSRILTLFNFCVVIWQVNGKI